MEERRLISPGFVADALSVLNERGIAAGPLLAQAGIDTGAVSEVQYGRLWWLIAQETGCEFFGLGARPMRPGSFALLCQAALHAGTLERALRRILDFLNIVLDGPRGELRIAGREATLVLHTPGPAHPAFACRTYWLIVMGVACWLIARRIPLRQLEFCCDAPPAREEYHQFFGVPVRFGAAENRLSFDAAWLQLPLCRSEAALRGFLREAPGNILLRFRHDAGVAARLRAILSARSPADWPGFEALAAELGLSSATLRRRLQAEGQSFATIRDIMLAERARNALSGPLGIATIATELGYSEPGAFHRAFVRWHGQSPGAWRRARNTDAASEPKAASDCGSKITC